MPSTLFQKEREAFGRIRPGHFVSWFKPTGDCSSEITCASCGASGNVSTLGGGALGLIFLAECQEVRTSPELLALTR